MISADLSRLLGKEMAVARPNLSIKKAQEYERRAREANEAQGQAMLLELRKFNWAVAGTAEKHLQGKHPQQSHGRGGGLPPVIGDPHPTTLQAVTGIFGDIADDFPELRQWVKGLDFSHSDAIMGEWDNFTHTFRMNRYDSKMTPDEINRQHGKNSDFVGGHDPFVSTVNHEFGHALANGITHRLRGHRDAQDEWIGKVDALRERVGFVSKYGETNRGEWLAERFAQERMYDVGDDLHWLLREGIDTLDGLGLTDTDLPVM